MKRIALLFGALLVFGWLLPAPAPAQDKGAEEEGALELQVVDAETKEPLPDVQIGIYQDRQSIKNRTDAQGRAFVFLAQGGPDSLVVRVKTEGYVPKSVHWGGRGAKEKIPASYIVKLERGTEIGGVVQDDTGKPVDGAVVHMLIARQQADARESVDVNDLQATTDAMGRWKADQLPHDLNNLLLRLSHSDYISEPVWGTVRTPAAEDLLKGTAVLVMKRGFEITGIVKGPNGSPVAGATLLSGSDRGGSALQVKTDKAGNYRFRVPRSGAIGVLAQAKGFAPEMKTASVSERSTRVDFELGAPKTIHGKVVDTEGKPVAGAMINLREWRGSTTLQWSGKSRDDGTFEWTDAPADEVSLNVVHPKMRTALAQKTNWKKELVVTLHPAFKITGTVVDAETGDLIPAFEVTQGFKFSENRDVNWQTAVMKREEKGKFESYFRGTFTKALVRITADGYIPVTSPEYPMEGPQGVFEAKLKKGSGPSGIVLLPDGTPAAGAHVAIASENAPVTITNGLMQQRGMDRVAITTKEGKFSFPPQTDQWKIVAVHQAGCLELEEADLQKAREFKLQPWGQVEVTLMKGKKPWPDQTVSVVSRLGRYDPKQPQVYFRNQGATDGNGRAIFNRVKPASEGTTANRMVQQQMGQYSTTISAGATPVVVKPGELTRVQIGGRGRPVVGKIDLPKEAAHWVAGQGSISLMVPRLALPREWSTMTEEQRDAFRIKNTVINPRSYPLTIAQDGSFRVDDVEPGEYRLNYAMHDPGPDGNVMFGNMRASARSQFKVEEVPDGYTDVPLDIGLVPVQVLKSLPPANEQRAK